MTKKRRGKQLKQNMSKLKQVAAFAGPNADCIVFYGWIDGWLGSKERKLGSKERKCCVFVAGLGSGWGLGCESALFS